jgi:DNA-binding response OmpR family regulator
MSDLSGLKILVIEDTDMLLEFHESWMKTFKINSFLFLDGRSGLEYFHKDPDIDLVILDLDLPDISGYEVFAEIRQHRVELPVIISSGYNDDFSGFNTDSHVVVLQKPFSLSQVTAAVANLTGRA